MTVTCGFFNSISGDRTYDTVDISKIFDGIIEEGVFAKIGDHLAVVPSAGMAVSVGVGRAWFDHTWTYNDADLILTLSIADAILKRYDAIVLEVNEDVAVRANSIKVVEGTPASNPVYPTLTNTSTIHQHPLAYVYIKNGATVITQADIKNYIGTGTTPYVTGPLETIDADALLVQWESQFQQWFDAMKGQLTTDAAGNLQAEINAIVGDTNPPVISLLALKTHDHVGGDGNVIQNGGLAAGSVTKTEIANRTRKIFIPSSELRSRNASPSNGLFFSWLLEPNDDIEVYGGFGIPSDWASGPVNVYAWWFTANASGADGVRFKFAYFLFNDSSYGNANPLNIYTTDNPQTTDYKLKRTLIGPFTPTASTMFVPFIFSRLGTNASDTMTQYAYLLGLVFEYTADS